MTCPSKLKDYACDFLACMIATAAFGAAAVLGLGLFGL